MHVLLASLGTDGDIFPYIGLGLAAQERGHTATLVASETYRRLARAHGLGFEQLVTAEENNALFLHPHFWTRFKSATLMAKWGARLIPRKYEILARLTKPGTVLVSNPGILASPLIAEKLGIPWASLILQPWMVPSAQQLPIIPGFSWMAQAPLPFRKLFIRAIDAYGDWIIGRENNRLRVQLGLRPVRRIFQHWLSPRLIIGMFPDWFGVPQSDWPRQLRLTGFPLFDGSPSSDESPDRKLDSDVVRFCESGSPPVAVTFGSGMAHSATLFENALEALETIGARALLLTKFAGQLPKPLPPWAMHISFAPFQKLFPLCRAVLHHGGIGTVAKALRTGTPQLVHPICFDQIDNGMRVANLGAGACLQSSPCRPEQIASALRHVLASECRARCVELKNRFEGKDSLAAAAACVESLAGSL